MAANPILRRTELLQLIGVSRSTLYQWMATGQFPRPLLLGKRAVGWKSEAVADWLSSRQPSI
ncbi:AlpA family phage regulatory protein [Sphingomonas sp. Leaf339]|uniref:helix-turn-helix transcriptional regulator n=1 Tax=Sphingomonas sp. Leaf339 TaxID=1736343 RepID=UPI0009E871E9